MSGRSHERGPQGAWLEESLPDSTQICRHTEARAHHPNRATLWEQSSLDITAEHAVAGIDPHKHTSTIAVLDARGGLRETASFPISPDGVTDLLAFLVDTEVGVKRIGMEGSGSLGRPLVLALTAAGYDVREVQPNRTAERRRRRRRAKTDTEDAEAIAREALADPQLPPAGKHHEPTPAWHTLATIRDWRKSLVLQRVRLLTEADAVLVSLPVVVRCALPSTTRVLPQLKALAANTVGPADLTTADRVKIDWLLASFADIARITDRIKEFG